MNQLLRYDLVIFDCDGVLIDSELLSCNALVDCLRRAAIEMDLETVIDRFLGRSPQAIRDYCAATNHVLPERFFEELHAAVLAVFAAGLTAIPGAAAVLESLKAAYCVASSSNLDRIKYALELTGLAELMAGRVFSAEMVKRGKPAPDLFLHAASRMAAAPNRTLVIEDSVTGVQAGKAAGMTVWGFVGGSHYAKRNGQESLMAAGADRVFDRMAEFHRQGAGLVHGAVEQ